MDYDDNYDDPEYDSYRDELDENDPYDRYMMYYLLRALEENAEGLTIADAEDGMNTALAVIRQSMMNGIPEDEAEWIINIRVDAMATAGHGARWYRAQWRRLVDENLADMMKEGE